MLLRAARRVGHKREEEARQQLGITRTGCARGYMADVRAVTRQRAPRRPTAQALVSAAGTARRDGATRRAARTCTGWREAPRGRGGWRSCGGGGAPLATNVLRNGRADGTTKGQSLPSRGHPAATGRCTRPRDGGLAPAQPRGAGGQVSTRARARTRQRRRAAVAAARWGQGACHVTSGRRRTCAPMRARAARARRRRRHAGAPRRAPLARTTGRWRGGRARGRAVESVRRSSPAVHQRRRPPANPREAAGQALKCVFPLSRTA
jgi:hypothetical protein